jgi:histidine triad (HIT) family protein
VNALPLVLIHLTYYTDFDMADCIFCKIAKRESPASVALDSKNVIAFKSIDPAAEHHYLIVSKKHIIELKDVTSKDKDVLYDMVEAAQALIKKHNLTGGYKLIFNGGKYPEIKHLHWHLLGGELEENYHEKT